VLLFKVNHNVLVVLVIEVLHKTHAQDFLLLIALGRDVLFIGFKYLIVSSFLFKLFE